MSAFTMWRCAQCGKWSHAVRKPLRHQRAVFDEPEDATVIRYEQGYYDQYAGESTPDVWWIACGPFAEFVARALPVGTQEADQR